MKSGGATKHTQRYLCSPFSFSRCCESTRWQNCKEDLCYSFSWKKRMTKALHQWHWQLLFLARNSYKNEFIFGFYLTNSKWPRYTSGEYLRMRISSVLIRLCLSRERTDIRRSLLCGVGGAGYGLLDQGPQQSIINHTHCSTDIADCCFFHLERVRLCIAGYSTLAGSSRVAQSGYSSRHSLVVRLVASLY
jgi:hypothetical protein